MRPWPRIRLWSALACLLLLVPPLRADEGKVTGTMTYEKIPFRDAKAGKFGLQPDHPKVTAVAGARVELLAAGMVVGETYTDASGNYVLTWKLDKDTPVQVRLSAYTSHVEVRDKEGKLHAVTTDEFSATAGESRKDLLAKDGGGGAGAFNILEAIRLADTFLEKYQQGIREKLPRIRVSWTPGYNGPPGFITSFSPRNNSAFIYGDRSTDSDEYDDFVVIHEYGHFIMANFSRSDSPGGSHPAQAKLDPRLAWSEGWANFFASAVLNDSLYVDTGMRNGKQVALLTLDLDRPIDPRFTETDYWCEHTVGSALWHLFSKKHEGLGFQPIWDVVTGPLKDRPFATLVDCCDLLAARDADTAKAVTRVLGQFKIAYRAVQVPSVDTPYVRPLTIGKEYTGTVDALGKEYWNFDASHFYVFTLDNKAKVKIFLKITDSKSPANADLDLFVYDKFQRIGWSDASNGVGGTETVVKTLDPGTYYAEIKSWASLVDRKTGQVVKLQKNTGTYSLTVTLEEGNKGKARGAGREIIGEAWALLVADRRDYCFSTSKCP
jgi:hypothetical protein